MLFEVCPTHYLFYACLHRRRLWLEQINHAFSGHLSEYELKIFQGKKNELDHQFRRDLEKLSVASHLGIKKGLPLKRVLDDTPPDSFLLSLGRSIAHYEIQLLKLIQATKKDDGFQATLIECSKLWGRLLAQESLRTLPATNSATRKHSIFGLLENIQSTLTGGEFRWKPLLIRRYTGRELCYESRSCPHTFSLPPSVNIERKTFDLACALEAAVYQGFVEAIYPNARFTRVTSTSNFCYDKTILEPTPNLDLIL